MESSLKRCSRAFTRSPSLQIQALEEPSSLQLIFTKKVSLPIFTGSKIVDTDGSSLQILLVDTRGDQMILTSLPHTLKVEIVVVDGDFPLDDRNTWTPEDFNNNIVKERTGKRPLLAGDCLTVALRDGIAPVGEIEFTDNSSWIRSRKFRIGARIAPGNYQGVRIREAMTEAFVVKDHRGELYKKHHPPMLEDEVWRLEKIGKDGAFHKKLTAANILSVQDFLKLSIVDPQRLRRILGHGMSEKMWEVTIKHARECEMGNKHYIYRGSNFIITLNPICQVVNAVINGQSYSTRELSTVNRSYIENLVRQAYTEWNSLEEVVEVSNETALLTQGEIVDQYPNNHQAMTVRPIHHQSGYSSDYHQSLSNNNANLICTNNWQTTTTTATAYHGGEATGGIHYSISESSMSDGDLTPARSYVTGN